MSLQGVTAIIAAIGSLATLASALTILVTTSRTHKLVNSNHQQDLARIDQLTNTIANATGVEIPDRPPEPEATT